VVTSRHARWTRRRAEEGEFDDPATVPAVLRVLIAAFDGLQPAQVSPGLTPVLHRIVSEGVLFTRHHAVFPTVTRTNAASMVTGRHPGDHGLAANAVVMPEMSPGRVIDALEPTLARLAEVTGGRVLLAPTLGEMLARHGRRYAAVVGGTSGNAYVHHPRASTTEGAVVHSDFSLPASHHQAIHRRFGPWPEKRVPSIQRIERVADVLLDYVLSEIGPDVATVWFPEPDTSQHAAGVGSSTAGEALRAADAQLGAILGALSRRGLDPDVLVVSDHGYSTIASVVDVEAEVRRAGFPGGEQLGGVAVAPNGGAALFYVRDGDPGVLDRLATWLAAQPWAGALVGGRGDTEALGLLPGQAAGIAGPRAPDIAMSLRWDSDPGANGFLGRSDATGGVPGQGTHGSGSPHDLRGVLIAAGPSFRRGVTSDLPSGSIDLAPTVLAILGLAAEAPVDGRVLTEGLRAGAPSSPPRSTLEHVVERRTGAGRLIQRLLLERVGTTTYVAGLEARRV
jgi:arylsulfatase A-like enzyme